MENMEKNIDIDNLLLDENNPRIHQADNQKHAIKEIIRGQGDKLYHIALHIAENGLSPLHRLAIVSTEDEKGKYLVIEGNRRVSAVKLIICPDLALGTLLEKKIAKLHEQYAEKIQRKVPCYLFADLEEAKEWRKVEHYNEQNGIQQEGWSAMAKARVDHAEERFIPGFSALKLALSSEFLSDDIKKIANSDDFHLSTLDRIIKSRKAKAILKIQLDKGKIIFHKNRDWTLKIISRIITVIAKKSFQGSDFTARTVNDSEQIKEFVEKIVNEIGDSGEEEIDERDPANEDGDKPPTEREPDQPAKTEREDKEEGEEERKNLIPKNHPTPNFNRNKKIKKLYKELKGHVATDKAEISVALAFRVLLEISLKEYCEKNNIQKKGTIKEKAFKVLDDMVNREKIEEKDLKMFQSLLRGKRLHLTAEFNYYVHSPKFYPMMKDLHHTWDQLESFFDALWENGL